MRITSKGLGDDPGEGAGRNLEVPPGTEAVAGETRGQRLVRKLRGGAPPGGPSTDEIMAWTRGED